MKKVFNGVDGIGGGCGLPSLIPYFNGNGFYQGNKIKDDRKGNYEFSGRQYFNNYITQLFGNGFKREDKNLRVGGGIQVVNDH